MGTRAPSHTRMSESEELSGDEGGEQFQFQEELSKVAQLPPEVQRRVNALKNLLLSNVKHEVEYYKELHQLDLKYQKLYDQSQARRREICSGEYEPSKEEAEWVDPQEDVTKKLNDLNIDEKKSAEKVKGIPDFWL